jgi:Protein of unknown function (DUF3987)
VNNEEFFDSRQSLRHILKVARGLRVGPWSLLGATMVKANSVVPPGKRLPALVGSEASLNLFVGLVAGSGGGKGISEGAAQRAFDWPAFPDPPWLPLGSGEGIGRTYADDGEESINAAVFSAAEVDGLSALAGRQGANLTAELRKAFSGEPIGFANAQKHTRVVIKAHSYRLCLIAGIQPDRSGPLLAAADGGLPQRFVWLPTEDPETPDIGMAGDPPDPLRLNPAFATPGARVIPVPQSARLAVEQRAVQRLRGTADWDPLDAHALLVQLKVAAALAVLDNRQDKTAEEVTEEDWALAGHVMAISTRTRQRCLDAVQDQFRRRNRAKAVETADREELVSDRRLKRTKDGILRRLNRMPEHDPVLAKSELRSNLKGDLRDYFGAAIAELLEEGRVAEVELLRGKGYFAVQGPALVQGAPSQVTNGGPPLDPGPTREKFHQAMHLVTELNSKVADSEWDTA